MTRIRRRKSGQMRIIEAAIAATILFMTLVYVTQSTRLPRITMTARSGSLRDTAYNTLYRMADSGVFERLIGTPSSPNWERNMKMVLDALLPATTYFNMTVYAYSSPTICTVYNKIAITNVYLSNAFTATPEISSALFLFVAKNSKMYLVQLQLAEGGTGT